MNTVIKKIGSLVILSILTIAVQAQSIPDEGTVGLRANFTGQTSIEVPYMLNQSFSLAPYIGINSTQDQTTNIAIGIRPRFYTGMTNAISPYFTGTLGFSNTSFSNVNNSVTDFNLGVGYGAEYFFSDQFSVSADGNLNLLFGDSATNFSTMARVSASIYF
ncbi:MAG: outer membrane beta-barrel protein [Gracilimonas sp.]|uniref:outer membrane beta-barrel protein n=1 Tax=Gracilimonas sp. TaxID=1974203 RepID=UPI001996B8B2|nr:outer membrane beta-barrel protein [Gracilimonas sp.]MBD3615828.1 outer membrane beta-barrel protein [Gracilimonas sp.]